MTTTENIVIVGGGYAGVSAAQELEKQLAGNSKYRVVLIDKKSFFYHIVGGPRAAVEHINNIIPYSHTFKDMKKHAVVQATVVRLGKNKIHLDKPFEGSIELSFAYAVLATGIRYPTPAKVKALDSDAALKEQGEIQSLVKDANSILIVGGGPTGIELAGEIREKYNEKKITLVHDQKQLLQEGVPDKPRAQILRKLEKNNIKVILDETVELSTPIERTIFKPEGPLRTRKGVDLSADLVMLMFGTRPETEWLKDTLPLESNGFVKVKSTLQVDAPGFENVYATGDAASIKEIKMAARTKGHASVVVANIVNATKGKAPSQNYKPNTTFLMALTFGKKQGFLFTPMGNMGDWIASKLKSKTMMTESFWQTMNLTEPTNPNKPSSDGSSMTMTTITIGVVAVAAYYAVTTQGHGFSSAYHHLVSLYTSYSSSISS
ncbi:hypothetical protein BDB00DRAFT_800365 [Zychaea mexicana]|uniref:uncharacterized protein n=1 Tax=Zychaea mexicana TaxID=64656 RepID=UPI0022FE6F7C|nr:uncharacterized protein BDB00DRAFT_800365 [Zychaea mexicana]KAI9498453.1 hypothetical protein BDB00DRAFT_800365 [Zychaea mexicana]